MCLDQIRLQDPPEVEDQQGSGARETSQPRPTSSWLQLEVSSLAFTPLSLVDTAAAYPASPSETCFLFHFIPRPNCMRDGCTISCLVFFFLSLRIHYVFFIPLCTIAYLSMVGDGVWNAVV